MASDDGSIVFQDSRSGNSGFSDTHTPVGTFSRYKNDFNEICRLGKGGCGTVMKAEKKFDKQLYAVKMVKVPCLDNNERLLQEARLLASLCHPNIVRYHDSWVEPWNERLESDESSSGSTQEDNDKQQMCSYTGVPENVHYLFIQMELCVGTIRSEIIENQQKVNHEEVARLLYGIVQGLQYFHSKGICHRDLNPSNIFLDASGKPKIGDFGLARLTDLCYNVQHGEGKSTSPFSNVGTRMYKAPEITQKYDERVDHYSLGIILFEMSYPMSTGTERIEVLEKLREPEVIFPENFLDHGKEWQEQLCRLLLQHSADRRPSLDEILSILSEKYPLENTNFKELVVRALKDPASKSYRQVMQSCFDQRQHQVTISYGASNVNQSMSAVQSLTVRYIENVFKKQGAIHKATPLLTPMGIEEKTPCQVHLMTQDGLVVNLPYNAKVNFARFVVFNEIGSLTRYDTLQTYEEQGNRSHPHQKYECVFDIITQNPDNVVADAHIVNVLMAIFKGMLPDEHATNFIAISHIDLVKAVLLSVGVKEHHLPCALGHIGRNGFMEGLRLLESDQFKETGLDSDKLHRILELSGDPDAIQSGLLKDIDVDCKKSVEMAIAQLKDVLVYHRDIIGNHLHNVEISLKWCGNCHYYSGILFTAVRRHDDKRSDIVIADGGRFDDILRSLRADLSKEMPEILKKSQQYGVGISVYPMKVLEIQQDFWPPELVIITCSPKENLERNVYDLAKQLRSMGFSCREEFNLEASILEANKIDESILCLVEYLPAGDINVTHKFTNLNQVTRTLSIGMYNPQPPTIKIRQEDVLAMFTVNFDMEILTDMVAGAPIQGII